MSKNPGRVTYNPMYEMTEKNMFGVAGRVLYKWNFLYPGAQLMTPCYIPEYLVKSVLFKDYVGVNHAENMANSRSHSRIIIYVNNAPIIWYSNCQNTVESSSFGLYFVALIVPEDIIEDLYYTFKKIWVASKWCCRDIF